MTMTIQKLSTDLTSQRATSVGVYGYPMKKLMGYLTDYIHERRITRARLRVMVAVRERASIVTVRLLWSDLRDLIAKRSATQVERMERRMGLR